MLPISDKLIGMINAQAGRELGNSLLYRHFSSWCHTKGLPHIEAFFLGESEGEVGHHKLLTGFLDDANAPIAIPAIEAKPSEFTDCMEIGRAYIEAEAATTDHLMELYQVSEGEKNIGLSDLLQSLLREQTEEEGLADRTMNKIMLSNGNLLLLDLSFEK
jgi:ferritin